MTTTTGVIRLPLTDHRSDHNRIVNHYLDYGPAADIKLEERALLKLAEGLGEWVAANDGIAGDGYFGPNVFGPLCEAFCAALNGPTGRLDCGTLDGWARRLAGSVGVGLHGEEPAR